MSEWESSVGGSLVRWIAILPFVAAMVHGLLIGLVRARLPERSVWAISLSALVTSFGLSALMIFELVGPAGGHPILDTLGPWIGGGVGPRSFSAELTFQLDPLSVVFCLAVTSIAIAVYLYTIGLLRSGQADRESGHRIFAMLDLLVGSTLVLILADNLLLFFLGWTGVGIASQLFSAFAFEDREASRAGAVTFVVGRIGDLGLLAGILLIFDGLSRAGAPTLSFRGIEGAFRLLEGQHLDWLGWGGGSGPLLLEVVGFALVLAALTKCAQFPLHFWLSNARAIPVPANALMQSSTTVVVGIYLLLRLSFLLGSAPNAMMLLVVVGATTALLASLAAATQNDMMRVLAFSTSSLLGMVLITLGIGAFPAAAYLLLTHAYVKAELVLAFGIVIVGLKGETDLRRMGGLAEEMRWTHVMVALGCLALVGVPPLADFFPLEESIAFIGISERNDRSLLIALFVASLGILAFAMARAYFLVFWGSIRPRRLVGVPIRDPIGWRQHGLTILAVATVAAGLLTPSQFWGDPWDVSQMDSVGHFLMGSIPGQPDPLLSGGPRWRLISIFVASAALGVGLAAWRHARRGHPGESERAFVRYSGNVLREMLYVERVYDFVLIRPIRGLSRWALVGMIETRLIDRVVVSGGASLVRRAVWSGLRRLQNGRLQSYALLGLLTALVVIYWMVS